MREALGLGLAANEGFWNSISTEFHLTAPEMENHGINVTKSWNQSRKSFPSQKID